VSRSHALRLCMFLRASLLAPAACCFSLSWRPAARDLHSFPTRRSSDLVNDVLRSVRQQQQQPFEITPELEAWLLEAADKPATPLDRKSTRLNSVTSLSRMPSSA